MRQPGLPEFAGIWASLSPELKEVVLALPSLPEPLKAGIAAIVRATGNAEPRPEHP